MPALNLCASQASLHVMQPAHVSISASLHISPASTCACVLVTTVFACFAGGGYMDLMTAEQAGHFLQSQANHQSSSLANGDLPHAHHAQATHNGHQVAAGLAQVTCPRPLL